MKFARTLTFAGIAGSTLATIIVAQGCGSSSTEETADASKTTSSSKTSGSKSSSSSSSGSGVTPDAGTDAGGGTGLPPAMSGSVTPTPTAAHNFAIHHLYIGDTDPNPTYMTDPAAWKTIGYNLDGLDTTAKSTNVCKPYTNGMLSQQVDGVGGIDNAFGSTIVPALGQLGINLSQTVYEKIIQGAFTIEIDTAGLDSTVTSQTATGLGGQLFAGLTYPGTPPLNSGGFFALTDDWPVSSELLTSSTPPLKSMISFPASYVTNGTWVSGTPIVLNLSLSLEGQTLNLQINSALVTFDYSVVGGQGIAKNGIIAGVLDTAQLLTAIKQVLGDLGTPPGEYCSFFSLVVNTIENAQDIIIDPSTGAVSNMSGTPCNGISIGLAFDADEIVVPDMVAPKTDAGTPHSCAVDGG